MPPPRAPCACARALGSGGPVGHNRFCMWKSIARRLGQAQGPWIFLSCVACACCVRGMHGHLAWAYHMVGISRGAEV